MQSRPADLTDGALARVLAQGWGVEAEALQYRPVGFGSHHWTVADSAGTRWFVTADGAERDHSSLRAALATAIDLRAAGCEFVVAPIPTDGGQPFAIVDGYAVALYEHIDGEHYTGGQYTDDAHRDALLELVIRVHALPLRTVPHARPDDLRLVHRDAIEAGLAGRAPDDTGPYAAATAALLAAEAPALRTALSEYDALTARVRAEQRPAVVTHGEPHAANTISTPAGLVLVDWESVLVAAPERDLWDLDGEDAAPQRAYTRETGRVLSPDALALYRLQWDLRDVAEYVARFGRHHGGNADDEKSWAGLDATLMRLRDGLGPAA